MRRSERLLAALLFVALGAVVGAQQVRVTPLALAERVLVSFEVPDAFTDEMRASIESGLSTTFTYDVDLRRGTTLWVDRLISSARVSAIVQFDNLTRLYQVTVTHDGRVEQTLVTPDENEVRALATAFHRLPLFGTRGLEPNAEYYVRVRARTSPKSQWSLVPWERASLLGSARFTFIPR